MLRYRRWLGLLLILSLFVSAGPLLAAESSRQDATHIAYGDVAHGRVDDNAPEQLWQFDGQAGDIIVIDMRADLLDSLDTFLTLINPMGVSLMTDDDGGDNVNARIGPFTLPDTGLYSIYASRYTGSGDYTLSLQNLTTVATLALDKALVGHVTAAAPTEYFSLNVTGTEDRLLRLQVSDDDLYYDPYLSFYGPNGLLASSETGYDTSALDPIAVHAGESYTVAVGWNSNSAGGAYQLLLTESTVSLLEPGTVQTGSLSYDTETQSHFFRAQSGQNIRVTVRTTDEIPLGLSLQTTDGMTSLFYSYGDSAHEISIVVMIPQDTVYRIDVSDTMYSGIEGTYTIETDIVE